MIACVFLLSILFSHVTGKDKAILEIVMHKSDRNGDYTTEVEKLLGHFTTAGSMVSAEGQVFQIHPLSICSNELSTEQFEFGWVGVMRLEQIDTPCMSLFQQTPLYLFTAAVVIYILCRANMICLFSILLCDRKVPAPVILKEKNPQRKAVDSI